MVLGHEHDKGLKDAKGFKYDRTSMTWAADDAPATTGAPARQ